MSSKSTENHLVLLAFVARDALTAMASAAREDKSIDLAGVLRHNAPEIAAILLGGEPPKQRTLPVILSIAQQSLSEIVNILADEDLDVRTEGLEQLDEVLVWCLGVLLIAAHSRSSSSRLVWRAAHEGTETTGAALDLFLRSMTAESLTSVGEALSDWSKDGKAMFDEALGVEARTSA